MATSIYRYIYIDIFSSYKKNRRICQELKQISFFNSEGSPLLHPVALSIIKLQCENIVNSGSLLRLFKTKKSRESNPYSISPLKYNHNYFLHNFAITRINLSLSNGFDKWAFIPAFFAFILSSVNALAVIATIGIS